MLQIINDILQYIKPANASVCDKCANKTISFAIYNCIKSLCLHNVWIY